MYCPLFYQMYLYFHTEITVEQQAKIDKFMTEGQQNRHGVIRGRGGRLNRAQRGSNARKLMPTRPGMFSGRLNRMRMGQPMSRMMGPGQMPMVGFIKCVFR